MAADSQAKVRQIGLLVFVTAAGFALRFVNIDQWPLWGDEALTLLLAQWPVQNLFLAPIDPTPGLYYALHKIFLGPMVDAAEARYLSLAFGTLLIPAVYFLAREARAPALLSAALVALSFPLIDYSQEARAYALLVLLVTCSAIFFIRWTRSRQQGQLLLALLFAVLAFYTHVVSIFWIGPMCLAVVWLGRRQSVQPLLLFVLLAVPEIHRILIYRPGNFSWLAQASPIEAADTLSKALLPFRVTGLPAAAIAAVIAWRIWEHRKRIADWIKSNPGAAYALAVLICVPAILWFFGLVAKPIFMTRTILVAVPALLLGLALLLRFERRLVRLGVVALYAGSLLVTGTARQRDEWREIAARVGDDTILMCQPWQAAAMRHAVGGNNRMLLRYDDGLREVWGEPWPVTYYQMLMNKKRAGEAKLRGMAANLDSYPVWPVRSGKAGQMMAAPVTLRQAIAFCDSVQPADRQARYIAD